MTAAIITRLIKAAAVSVLVAGAPAAFSQQSACVYLTPGSGYAAWIRVVSGSFTSEWSSSFPIGQHRCVSLTPIGDGQPFTVEISAVLGSSKVHCKPDDVKRVASSQNSITYLASGTTFSVKCVMPAASGGADQETSATPSPEGLKAADYIKQQGAKLKAPE